MAGSGKTTILETLHKITKESEKDIKPVEDLKKIEKASGATLYFDRGLFQSTVQKNIFFRVFTVAGISSYSPSRSQIFQGTDGVILVVDSQTKYLENNIESLRELKKISNETIIKEIPLIVMLNKKDLDETINEENFKHVLQIEKLWFEENHKLFNWNPAIYNTCALYGQDINIYRSFYECARRTVLYHISRDEKDDDDNFPSPYIFNPPQPPGDLGLAAQPQVKIYGTLKEKGPEDETHCQYCGRKLIKEEYYSHNCRSKP